MAIILGVPKKIKLGFRISVLNGFYCAMWSIRCLLNSLGVFYIKIKYCQAILKVFHYLLLNFDPSKSSCN